MQRILKDDSHSPDCEREAVRNTSIAGKYKLAKAYEQICRAKGVTLVNRKPQWKASLNGYCLNFRGRVRAASIKNFQLVDEARPQDLVMQVRVLFSLTPELITWYSYPGISHRGQILIACLEGWKSPCQRGREPLICTAIWQDWISSKDVTEWLELLRPSQ